MTTPAELLARIAQLLEDLGIPYHVGGSIASSWYGQPRATADIDFVIDLAAERLERFASALEREFYVSRDAMSEALLRRTSFNAISLDSPFKIDFFVLGQRDFDREEFGRAISHTVDASTPKKIAFKSPEDMILRKLEWFRLGGEISDQQWRDVLGMLIAMAGRLDDTYLDRWAVELSVADLLARARRETADL